MIVHLEHVKVVFQLMKRYRLYAKLSKCAFGVSKVKYLGRFISKEWVSTDPRKITAVQQCLIPNNIKQLRRFLVLARYYRRFIKGFGPICKPLHEMIKNDGFLWIEGSTIAFYRLKQALTYALVFCHA